MKYLTCEISSSPGWIRTSDTRINSPPRYHCATGEYVVCSSTRFIIIHTDGRNASEFFSVVFIVTYSPSSTRFCPMRCPPLCFIDDLVTSLKHRLTAVLLPLRNSFALLTDFSKFFHEVWPNNPISSLAYQNSTSSS